MKIFNTRMSKGKNQKCALLCDQIEKKLFNLFLFLFNEFHKYFVTARKKGFCRENVARKNGKYFSHLRLG